MTQTAILLGATGLVGSKLLDNLLNDDAYSTVKVFTRRDIGVTHAKLEQIKLNLFNLENFESQFTGDVVFCCIGTTKAKTPDKTEYKKIDCGIPLDAAKLAGKLDIPKFLVISAMGANHKSSIFYNRVKGEMERAVDFYHNDESYFFRPALISGQRKESRLWEKFGQTVFSIINPILPKNYKSIRATTIAEAMLKVSKEGYKKSKIPSGEIRTLANNGRN